MYPGEKVHPDDLLAIEDAIRKAEFVYLTPEQYRIAHVVADWVRIALYEAGVTMPNVVPGHWPSHADVDHSWLLHRLMQGIKPLPFGDERAKGLWHRGLDGE